ncbi:hypothetical protein D9C73_020140 [Collichthys lucidus]|uniref:Uncharacterized protein n=1 Tax=Collichthys lucidus TaxID=240159 RepID=A0A4U5VAX7_COLLU|nr:hypothetical protein D9C73_020140 [Collichthys lucidus]
MVWRTEEGGGEEEDCKERLQVHSRRARMEETVAVTERRPLSASNSVGVSVQPDKLDFEKRMYVATEWITTKIEGTGGSDVINANSKLKDYIKRQKDAGYTIPDDTWPVLITVTPSQDFSLSWFVPPGTEMPKNTDTLVTLQSKPEATVYVRVFSGTPSIQTGKDNANVLWNAMDKNCTDLPTYTGAGYDSYFSFQHHNEIWIYADEIRCKKDKLEGLLELRENEFKTEFKKSYETISSFEAQVSSLQKQLQSKNEEIDQIQLLRKQEKDLMAAKLDSEKQKVQESAVLQNDLQQKLKMMEQQLLQKDKEILDLQRNNHDLSHKLTEVSVEFQSDSAWQTKYNALQEKFTEEMAAKQQSCEATAEQLVEEKKKVEELQLKMKSEKTEKDKKDQEMKNKDKQEIDRLYQKLTETTSELRSCRVEFLQSYKTWQGEYNALEKKFKEQLIQKQQDSEKTSKLVEEEKNSVLQKEEHSERSHEERVMRKQMSHQGHKQRRRRRRRDF